MSIKTFNYTKRSKIKRSDVRVRLTRADGGLLVTATYALGDYQFPPASRIWLEVIRGLERQRISCGTIARPLSLDGHPLDRFPSEDGLSFRLLVREETASEHRGLIQGEASNIRPDSDDGLAAGGRSLLPVDADESLGQLIWRVNFGPDGPSLLVNPQVGGKQWMFNGDVRASVLPSCVREILMRILLADMPDWPVEEPDEQDWRSLWLWWAQQLPGAGPVPVADDDYEEKERWVAEVVEHFARRFRTVDMWLKVNEGREQ